MSGQRGPAVALTIAGSDSGAGAGIQADLKSMAALGVFATTVVTAVTAQNTTAVSDVHLVPVPAIGAQIDAVLSDFEIQAVKTGMLASAGVVEAVGRRARAGGLPRLVVDPVTVASTGAVLLDEGGLDAYRRHLLPSALVTTPNLWEAALLTGADPATVRDLDDMERLARRIFELGPAFVVVKGGHLPGVGDGDPLASPDTVADVLYDGTEVVVLRSEHVGTPNTHGTGCSLSAAIAALLALDVEVATAVGRAKEVVHRALRGGASWHLGRGHGPLDHFGWAEGLDGSDEVTVSAPGGLDNATTTTPA